MNIPDNAPEVVKQYAAARTEGERLQDTVMQHIYAGFIAMADTCKGEDGLIDRTKLKDGETRRKGAQQFQHMLQDFAVTYLESSTTDELKKQRLAFGLFGINPEMLNKYLEAQKDAALDTGKFFGEFLQRGTAFGYFQGQNTTAQAKAVLSANDAQSVVGSFGLGSKVKAEKMSTDDLAELVEEYLKEGTVTNSFLAGKDYALN